VRGKFDHCVCVDLNHHELINEVFAEVCEVSNRRVEFRKVADGNRTFGSKAVGFDKNFRFLEPGKKVSVRAVELDLT